MVEAVVMTIICSGGKTQTHFNTSCVDPELTQISYM